MFSQQSCQNYFWELDTSNIQVCQYFSSLQLKAFFWLSMRSVFLSANFSHFKLHISFQNDLSQTSFNKLSKKHPCIKRIYSDEGPHLTSKWREKQNIEIFLVVFKTFFKYPEIGD